MKVQLQCPSQNVMNNSSHGVARCACLRTCRHLFVVPALPIDTCTLRPRVYRVEVEKQPTTENIKKQQQQAMALRSLLLRRFDRNVSVHALYLGSTVTTDDSWRPVAGTSRPLHHCILYVIHAWYRFLLIDGDYCLLAISQPLCFLESLRFPHIRLALVRKASITR